jgi:hypothetical protein
MLGGFRRALLTRVRGWLKPEGHLFLHIFTHRHRPARYDWRDPEDWMGQHFITGGIMPTVGLIRQFGDLFTGEEEGAGSITSARRGLSRRYAVATDPGGLPRRNATQLFQSGLSLL